MQKKTEELVRLEAEYRDALRDIGLGHEGVKEHVRVEVVIVKFRSETCIYSFIYFLARVSAMESRTSNFEQTSCGSQRRTCY